MTMEYTDQEIELFIREQLKRHGAQLVERFVAALEKNKNIDTGRLAGSFESSATDIGGGSELAISFNAYGRVMEAVGRKRRRMAGKNRDVWGQQNHRPKKIEWYNRNRYAGYGRLVRRIAAGMSSMELQRIRCILEEAKKELL